MILILLFLSSCTENSKRTNDVYLLASLINSECAECSEKEMALVGSVVLNRMRHDAFPDKMIDVIYDDNQFHGICNRQFKITNKSLAVAVELLMNGPVDTNIIYFYLRDSPNMKWRKNIKTIIKSQHHNFGM